MPLIEFVSLDLGNALLSAFLQVFFDRLSPHHLPHFVRDDEVRSELKKWRTTMAMIQALLSDAEEKQPMNVAVKLWLDDVQDLVYDAEEMLDEYATKSLKRDFEKLSILFNSKTMDKILGITKRFEDLCKKRSELGLMERTSTAVWRRPPSTCDPTETVVYGRDEDKAKLLKMMELRDEPSDPNFRVILIVGTAGVGKTTLAQLVYHDEALKDFKLKAWVYVSDDFDVFRISKSILESITHSSCDLKDLNEVQLKLKKKIVKKRFLLVLDDVWCKNKDSWELLKSPFMAGERGSIIIVTTRSTDIADIALKPGSCKHYELKLLTEDDCWGIFQEHALQSTELGTHPNFKSEVIKKCGGSPLAARTLGGLLSSKRRNDKWEDVLNNKIWGSQENSNILPVLKLSYYHLPSYLKRCFAYCAILPKNYKFEEKELVLLWMAEGFINLTSTNNKQPEDMGGEFFCDLLSSSIFQQSSGDASKFVMHNLFNDLAEWVSGETSFRLEDKLGDSQLKRLQRARHSSYNISKFDGKNKFKVFDEVKERLRTFLPIHLTRNLDDCYISNEVIFNLLPKFKKLRVLSLRKYHITKLPDSIGKLRYLRYLNLADTEIASLPESIKALFNLQILILRNCYRLKLPHRVGTLIHLRHLDIHRDIEKPKRHRRERPEIHITEMPLGMQELKYLQTLSNFIVGKEGSGSRLKDLKNLKFLSGELHISQLENLTDSYVLREAILSDKENLEVLILEWEKSRNENEDEENLYMLQPHANLKKLTINNYGGSAFPAWIGDPSVSNMVVLRLEGCENCTSLPSLGVLSKLKELTISGMKKLTTIDSGFYGSCSEPFQSLEILCLKDLKDLQEWSRWDPTGDDVHYAVFSRLRELSIVNCPLLSRRLPAHLPSLRKLVIQKCTELEVSISSIPVVCELEIDGCKKMVYTDGAEYSLSPNSIILSLSEFGNWFGLAFQKVEELKIKCPTLVSIPEAQFLSSLRALEITDCRDIKSLQEVMKQSTRLDRLVIEGCNSLKSVAEGQLPSSLKTLKISSCLKLRCLFDDGEANINGSLLKDLYVSECPALQSLSSTDQLPEALQHLEIELCYQLTTIGQLPETLKRLVIKRLDSLSSAGQLPASLEHLSIDNCPITTLLSTDHLRASLQHLEILSCSELRSLSSTGHLPASLQRLEIVSCSKLTSLSSTGHLPASLQHLQIASCSKLTRLSSGQLLPATLKNLNISRCGISFIADGLQNLYSLQELHILNLTSLSITNLQIYDQVMQRLHKLTSLRKLHIDGCEIAVSFPQEGREMMLPTSLTLLTLTNFRKLSRLSPKGFRNLASLEYLSIFECPNLKSFLKEDLPSSLLKLCISKCPKLTKHCQKGKQYWSNISNIPCVEIDGKYIYEP